MGDEIGVVLFVALLANLLFAGAWFIADLWPRASRLWRSGAALPPLVLGILQVVYVASEDSYRNDGTSRWQTYDAELITCLAVIAAAGAAAVGYAARGRAPLGPVAAWACGVSSVLAYVARLQMSN